MKSEAFTKEMRLNKLPRHSYGCKERKKSEANEIIAREDQKQPPRDEDDSGAKKRKNIHGGNKQSKEKGVISSQDQKSAPKLQKGYQKDHSVSAEIPLKDTLDPLLDQS